MTTPQAERVVWQLVTAEDRRQLRYLAHCVLRYGQGELSEVEQINRDVALGELHRYCTPERIVALTRQPDRGTDPAAGWVRGAHRAVRDFVRLVRNDLDLKDRFDVQRETIKRAHFALLARMGLTWQEGATGDVRDGLADAVHRLADERDVARDRLQQLGQAAARIEQKRGDDVEHDEGGEG